LKKIKLQITDLNLDLSKAMDSAVQIEKATLMSIDEVRNFYCFYANPKIHPEKTKELRNYLKNTYTGNGYNGFNDYVDEYHDPFSHFIYVADKNGTILSTLRIVEKTKNNLIPIEMGIVHDEQNRRYVISEYESTIDVNSFTVSNVRSTNQLFSTAGLYSVKKGFKTAYFLHDIDSPSIMRLYEKAGGKYTKELQSSIFFPGYTKIIDGCEKPALWKIMTLNKDGIEHLKDKASKFKCLI
jgi:hypothetical protein